MIGILAAPAPPYAENVSAIYRGLSEVGFVEGHNVMMEFRWAEGQLDRLPALAAELVDRQVAVIIIVGGAAPLAAAKNATSTIPHSISPWVRPGEKSDWGLMGKRLELLKELVPGRSALGSRRSSNLDNRSERAARAQNWKLWPDSGQVGVGSWHSRPTTFT